MINCFEVCFHFQLAPVQAGGHEGGHPGGYGAGETGEAARDRVPGAGDRVGRARHVEATLCS
jgi:hypothetical protein